MRGASAEPPGTLCSGGASMNSAPYEEFAAAALSHFHHLYFAARRFVRNATDADDLVQETYHLAFQHYRELRSLAHCGAWLQRILYRQAMTRHRRERCGPVLVLMDAGAEDDSKVAAPARDCDLVERISWQEVRRAIDALPPDLRVAVTLRDLEGFSYAQIATVTNCALGTVRSRIARARARLATKLRVHADECGIRRGAATVPDIPPAPPYEGEPTRWVEPPHGSHPTGVAAQ